MKHFIVMPLVEPLFLVVPVDKVPPRCVSVCVVRSMVDISLQQLPHHSFCQHMPALDWLWVWLCPCGDWCHTNLMSVYVYDFSPCSFFFILGILKETKSKLSTPLFWRRAASLRFCKFRFVFPPLTLWHKTRHLFGLHMSSHNYSGSPLFRLLMDNRIQRIPENTFHSLWKLAELWVTFSEGSDFWYW